MENSKEYLESFVALVLILGVLFLIILAIRNPKVFKYSMDLSGRLSHALKHSIASGHVDSPEYVERMYSFLPDYNRMLYRFWVPLKDENWLTPELIELLKTK